MNLYQLPDRTPSIHPESWIAPNAIVIGTVNVCKNASLWWNVVARGDNDLITIGENTNVQDGSVLHTDAGIPLQIGANCTIGHMVMLHGCTIGENSLIGIGSVIMNHAEIGKNCIVGSSSLVPEGKIFPDGVLILGSPAKVIRQLEPAEIERLKVSAGNYVLNWQRYEKHLSPI
ncbi:Putative acetyltransferase [Georgfuchsia toluolica]|uniref:Acetyltransferase n=1 Tax=Georgfuchsia toluolica TaxID=424218 RepID=A0A916J0W1_9PROT|nr:gamma carbonic anhydrase family protein [Georgfuchsia toluolica]CAG4882645.1 Putative acetyltransferase [Georgfuchsia toluolica]